MFSRADALGPVWIGSREYQLRTIDFQLAMDYSIIQLVAGGSKHLLLAFGTKMDGR